MPSFPQHPPNFVQTERVSFKTNTPPPLFTVIRSQSGCPSRLVSSDDRVTPRSPVGVARIWHCDLANKHYSSRLDMASQHCRLVRTSRASDSTVESVDYHNISTNTFGSGRTLLSYIYFLWRSIRVRVGLELVPSRVLVKVIEDQRYIHLQ